MRRFVLGIGPIIAAIGLLGQNQACGDCGGAAANCGCNSTPCCPQCCCTVMQTCQETVYEYKEMTAYKVVYEDVEDKAMVPCVEYEPAPQPVCVPDTVLVPPAPAACPPANPCGPCAAQNLVPMCICRKVMLEGARPVNKEKPAVSTHVVARQVPERGSIQGEDAGDASRAERAGNLAGVVLLAAG